eukprot:1158231-Pelagomonas_calceolata.AAC.6
MRQVMSTHAPISSLQVGLANAHPIAKLLGQDDHISELMSQFCAGLVPGVWPMAETQVSLHKQCMIPPIDPFLIPGAGSSCYHCWPVTPLLVSQSMQLGHVASLPATSAQMWSIVLIKYLQVQNVVISPAFGTLATFVMNIGLNFGFISAFGFKVIRKAMERGMKDRSKQPPWCPIGNSLDVQSISRSRLKAKLWCLGERSRKAGDEKRSRKENRNYIGRENLPLIS